ncbi:MAG: hypothetical protein HY823_02950 [Acidobacteria bacterium]|nr:hypothetical protein [Acidobacteriota bacterium]
MITKLISAATLFTAGSLAAGSSAQLGATPVPSPGSDSALMLAGGCGTKGSEGSCGKKEGSEGSCGKDKGTKAKEGTCGKEKAKAKDGKHKEGSCGKGSCGTKAPAKPEPKKDADKGQG